MTHLRAALPLALALVLGVLSIGCNHGGVRAGEDPNSRIITMQIVAQREGQQRPEPLPLHGHLRSGERFAVLSASQKPVYVTLLRKVAGDQYERLFPDRDSGAVPHASLRMPDDSGFYTLDKNTGTEELRLVASAASLTEPQAVDAARRYDQVGSRGGPPSPPPAGASGPAAPQEGDSAPVVKVQLAQNNVAVAAFSFVHD